MNRHFQAPWNIKDIAISLTLSAIIFAGVMFTLSKYQMPIKGIGEHWVILLGFILQWVAILGPMLILTWRKYGFKFRDFGFRKIGVKELVMAVIGAYLLYLGINFILSIIIVFSGLKIPGYQIQESLAPSFDSSSTAVLVGFGMIILFAPVIEEMFFRGFILRTLSNKWGVTVGNVVTALVFSSFHYPWQSFIPIFILGLIINSLVIKHESIWPAVAFHVMNNAIAFIFQFSLV